MYGEDGFIMKGLQNFRHPCTCCAVMLGESVNIISDHANVILVGEVTALLSEVIIGGKAA